MLEKNRRSRMKESLKSFSPASRYMQPIGKLCAICGKIFSTGGKKNFSYCSAKCLSIAKAVSAGARTEREGKSED